MHRIDIKVYERVCLSKVSINNYIKRKENSCVVLYMSGIFGYLLNKSRRQDEIYGGQTLN